MIVLWWGYLKAFLCIVICKTQGTSKGIRRSCTFALGAIISGDDFCTFPEHHWYLMFSNQRLGEYWYICSGVKHNPNIDFWVVSSAEFHMDNSSWSYLQWDWKFLFFAECLLTNTIGKWITSQGAIKLLFNLSFNHNDLPFDTATSTMWSGKLKFSCMIGPFQKWKSSEHIWLVLNIAISNCTMFIRTRLACFVF